MSNEQPKVDTEPNGYTDIALEYVPTALKGCMIIVLFLGVLSTAAYLAFSVHLYVSPIALLTQPEMQEALNSSPSWHYPAATLACAICSFAVANAIPQIDDVEWSDSK